MAQFVREADCYNPKTHHTIGFAEGDEEIGCANRSNVWANKKA